MKFKNECYMCEQLELCSEANKINNEDRYCFKPDFFKILDLDMEIAVMYINEMNENNGESFDNTLAFFKKKYGE